MIPDKSHLRRFTLQTSKPSLPIRRYLDGQLGIRFTDKQLHAEWSYATYVIGAALRERMATDD